MQQEPTTEQRLARLELQVADLQRDRQMQEARDLALLARIDGFIEDLRRVERVQLRGFDTIEVQIQEQNGRLARVENNIAVLAEASVNHKASIEQVAGNVTLILDILRGPQKTND